LKGARAAASGIWTGVGDSRTPHWTSDTGGAAGLVLLMWRLAIRQLGRRLID
jgi:hypothetical protein